MPNVLITDYPWSDLDVERATLGEAGLDLVAGPSRMGTAAAVEALVAGCDPVAIMCCWSVVSAAAIRGAPHLRHVARLGVGLDSIDVAAATAAGVLVTNVPDYCVEEVSDHAVALLLAWARGLIPLDQEVKRGIWEPAQVRRFCRIQDLTVGILGYGQVGRRVADKFAGFGSRLLVNSRSPLANPGAGVEDVSLDDLLAGSDAVVICAPLTPQTHHLFDEARLRQMRRGAFLVNVTRGSIVEADALIRVLDEGHLSGAGLDVVEGEPSPPAALTGRPDVIATPHVAFSSASSVMELRRRVSEEVVRVYRGQAPQQPCNQPAAG
jgi:D-3-phosphoglycerate dehydrogenase